MELRNGCRKWCCGRRPSEEVERGALNDIIFDPIEEENIFDPDEEQARSLSEPLVPPGADSSSA